MDHNKKILSLLEESVNNKIFSRIDLKRCKRLGSFQMILRNAEIKTIQKLFDDAQLIARMGYNLGTQELSFTITLPTSETHPIGKLIQLWEESQKSLIIWFMLGISPLQYEIESLSNDNHIANQNLKLFSDQTEITICKRTLDLPRNTLRIVLCPEEETFDPSTGRLKFIFSPTYSSITGLCINKQQSLLSSSYTFLQEELIMQKKKFIDSMILSFWIYMEDKEHYFAVESLRNALSDSLIDFFERGMDGQSATFLPPYSSPFSFYLYGTAGIGKSAFVRSLCLSLQFVLRKYVDPNKVVKVVKVPLNAFTPSNLNGILRVKGISDMSIERIIEQTVCKGGIVIFHLEENPDDPSLQEQLFNQISKMVDHLVSRYPEYRANILTIMTSNYSPSQSISKQAKLLKMTPPNHKQQLKWCSMMLKDRIYEMLKNKISRLKINLEVNVMTLQVDDLRPLEQWWRSIAFAVGSFILQHFNGNQNFEKNLHIIVDGELDRIEIKFPIHPEFPNLTLFSSNCFFYYKKEFYDDSITNEFNLPSYIAPMLTTIVQMTKDEFLKPAVIILLGEQKNRIQFVHNIRNYLLFLLRDRLYQDELELYCEDDKGKVFGNPNEILGGLFRFIDRVNNPNACNGEIDRFGLIIAHVNEIGQFILRELLEPGQSKTHRQVILFLLLF